MNSLFIGRWQPFHVGHKKLIDSVLAEGKPVVVAIRDTKLSDRNPYTVEERREMIKKAYGDNHNVQVIVIPDIAEVCYGRGVGWGVRELKLDEATEAISATSIRRGKESTKHGHGFTLWFTGLPSSGKSTIADAVTEELRQIRENVVRMDADIIRQNLWAELGYSKHDRDENIRRVAWLSGMLTENRIAVVASFISPYRDVRERIRYEIGDFVEVYVKCPLDVCIKRDAKGLYQKALAGEIKNFTGVSDPYEEPFNPEVLIESDKETVGDSVAKVVNKLKELEYI